MKKLEITLRLLRIPLDLVAVFFAFILAYYWRLSPELIPWVDLESPLLLSMTDFVWFSLQAASLIVLIFAWEKIYSLRRSYRFKKELKKILMLTAAAYTVIILYFFIVGIQFFSRFILGVSFVLAITFMLSHRMILRWLQYLLWWKGYGKRRILFIGGGKVLKELYEFWSGMRGFDLIGRLGGSADAEPKRLGEYEDLARVVKAHKVDEVVQVADVKDSEQIVEFCQLNYIAYRFVPNMLQVQRTNTEIDFVHEIPIITLRSSAIDWWARIVKRIMDIVGAAVGLIILSPIFLLIAIGLKIIDPGPVFYKSKRVSKDKRFWMWKFRSMVVDAEKRKKELMELNRRKGPLFKIDDDPRITRFGKFLRKSTLDELPQLWNVLKGDISLVGPRAHLPEEVEQYERHHRKVLAVKAGVTGLAQVSGRSKLDFEQEVKLDVYYLENWSLWMDIKIILKTFFVLFEGE